MDLRYIYNLCLSFYGNSLSRIALSLWVVFDLPHLNGTVCQRGVHVALDLLRLLHVLLKVGQSLDAQIQHVEIVRQFPGGDQNHEN